jgi:hypothetical protein
LEGKALETRARYGGEEPFWCCIQQSLARELQKLIPLKGPESGQRKVDNATNLFVTT